MKELKQGMTINRTVQEAQHDPIYLLSSSQKQDSIQLFDPLNGIYFRTLSLGRSCERESIGFFFFGV